MLDVGVDLVLRVEVMSVKCELGNLNKLSASVAMPTEHNPLQPIDWSAIGHVKLELSAVLPFHSPIPAYPPHRIGFPDEQTSKTKQGLARQLDSMRGNIKLIALTRGGAPSVKLQHTFHQPVPTVR